jgi:SAM-dependent methyltransferase
MMRHLPAFLPRAELWGVDVNADLMRWCSHNLGSIATFATTTLVPHLPFVDEFFDVVISCSVFPHIDDLQVAWLLELGRLLRPGGVVYLTIHDEHTVSLLDSSYSTCWLASHMREQPLYRKHKDAFDMLVAGRGTDAQVFYRGDYFRSLVPGLFRTSAYVKEAYIYQSGVVLERLAGDR